MPQILSIVLTKSAIIVSDRQQTVDSQRFWILRMGDAKERGLKIGIIDIHQSKIDWFKSGNFDKWLEEKMIYWSPKSRSADFRFIISEKDI